MANLFIYKCETPLHVGSGSEQSFINMPIQREIHTAFPKIEASGIKGGYRRFYEGSSKDKDALFGPEDDGSAHAGVLKFFDARLLFFPVKSNINLFQWVTCPYVLKRFLDDCILLGIDVKKINEIEDKLNNQKDLKALKIEDKDETNNSKIALEEFHYEVEKCEENIENLLELFKNIINPQRVMIISDENFQYYTEMSTEVNTRIKIGTNGVVEKGHLFTEEYLPSESVLYTFIDQQKIHCLLDKSKTDETLDEKAIAKMYETIEKIKFIQLGGNTTLGKGVIRVTKMENLNE